MQDPTSFDAVVIGSGAGGAAAAYRLAQTGWRVLILEKGRALPVDGTTLDVERVVTRGEFLSRESWRDGHGRPLCPEEHFNVGGKTRWYGAALLRFADRELSADAAHDCAGFPVTPQELAPYYDEIEQLLGVREFDCEPALQTLLTRFERPGSGWQVSPLPLALSPRILQNSHEARHFDGFASCAGLKHDAETALLARISSRPNVRLETGTEVIELLSAAGDPLRITGVRLRDGRVFTARHVLLAAGALHSPRLLARYLHRLDPRIRPPCADAVGRRLKLHLLTAMVAVSPGRKFDALRKTRYLTHASQPHSSVQPLGFDADLIASLMPKGLPRGLKQMIARRSYGFFLQTEDGSHPDNRVTEEADGVPVLDYERRRLPQAAREHRAFVHAFQVGLLRAGCVSFTRSIGLGGTAHACGTLPAGADPATSVVNARGQVHGLEGLFVVDGSALTRSSRVNPSLTIYAWGLRVADRLALGNAGAVSTSAAQLEPEVMT